MCSHTACTGMWTSSLQKMKRARECVSQQLDFNGKDIDEFELPGFRFHPTEQELVGFYLKNAAQGKLMKFNVIRMLDLYRYDPWELPSFSSPGEGELYFFVPRDKNGSGRTNRIAVSGYWKSTGADRAILDRNLRCMGLRKTLVFYEGRAPRGQKTDWVMKEYRMPDHHKPKVEVVVCRIHRKAIPRKWIEQKTLNPVEDQPSAHDDELNCSYKPDQTRFSSLSSVDKVLYNKDGARGERCTILSSESPESQEAQQIYTEVSSSSTENGWDVYGKLIDPAFEAFVDYNQCDGFSVCSNDRNLRFMDLLDSSSDCSCFDLEFPDSIIDRKSIGVKKEVQAAPDLSVNHFCNDGALYSHLNLEENYPSRDAWAPQSFLITPNTFNSSDGTASTPENYSFLDEQDRFSKSLPL